MVFFLLCGLVLPLAASAAAEAVIEDLVPVIRDDAVYVSFRTDGAFIEEVERAIETGLPVRFRFNVELKRVRGLWLDQSVAKRTVQTTVSYDNLTKRYSLTREIDGEIDATEVLSDVEAMRRFMTTFEAMRLFDVVLMKPNDEYYLQVNGVIRDRNLLLFVPWDVAADSKEAHFTYVP